jgi:hypothetical protein
MNCSLWRVLGITYWPCQPESWGQFQWTQRCIHRVHQEHHQPRGHPLRAVDNNVGVRALGVEGSDLGNTVAGTLGNLVAVVAAESHIKLDVDVVAAGALGSELGAGGIDEGGGAAIVVGRVVSASHEDDYIRAAGIELLRRSEEREGAKGEGVADDSRHD